MNKFLEELSRSIQGNRHIALLTDNAGWHTAKKLTVPSNITLIPLPPYAPELNAMEQVWEWIKNHFLSNQCYGVYEDIVTMACYAWNQLAHNVDLVKSIMYRDWINTPCSLLQLVLVDGYDISQVTEESLRSNISVILQDITMFHRSILENLQLAKYDATLPEIEEACKKARIHDDILRMPNGYHSIVGERGVKVSGGQRQRITIARAILKNAPILILDEATSALDSPTEALIQKSIDEVLETSNATTIVVAHRLSTLLHMDRILVFKHGKIVEDGTHAMLIAKGGLYKTLWDAQYRGFLPDDKNKKA